MRKWIGTVVVTAVSMMFAVACEEAAPPKPSPPAEQGPTGAGGDPPAAPTQPGEQPASDPPPAVEPAAPSAPNPPAAPTAPSAPTPAVQPVSPAWIWGTWTHPSAFYKTLRFTDTAVILTRRDNNRSFSITRSFLVYRDDTGDTFTISLYQNTNSGPRRFTMVFAISDDGSNILFVLGGPTGRTTQGFYDKA